jgi:hypothetical protein
MNTHWFDKIERRSGLLAILIFALEAILFRAYFTTYFAPYYPTGRDQVLTYKVIYQAYFSLQDHGLLPTLAGDLELKQAAFKSLLVPLLGLFNALVFGPYRQAIAFVNFGFFIVGQLMVWHYLNRRYGSAAGLLGSGLFLLSNTHYRMIGGFADLRPDYAGMVVFGGGFLSLLALLERPGGKSLQLYLLSFALALSTRSITGVYLLGAQSLLLFISLSWVRLKWHESERARWATRTRFLAMGFFGSLCEVGVFALACGNEFWAYYGGHKLTHQDQFVDSRFGVHNVLERFEYFVRSGAGHFHNFIVLGAVLFIGVLLLGASGHLPREYKNLRISVRRMTLPVLTFMAVAVAVYGAVTSYSPNGTVVGVLTIPLTIVFTIVVCEQAHWIELSGYVRIVAVIVTILGLANYVEMTVKPRRFMRLVRREGETVNQFYRDLQGILESGQNRVLIYWMPRHPGLDPQAFEIYLYEHTQRALPGSLDYIWSGIFAIDEATLLKYINRADVVVALLQMRHSPGEYEFPISLSIRDLQPVWQPVLERDFSLRQVGTVKNRQWTVGLYVRTGKIPQPPNKTSSEP